MLKERLSPELDPAHIAEFAATFLSRDDFYPRQTDNGGYFVVERALHVGVVKAHLKGIMTIGAYALSPTSEAKWLCIDADDTQRWNQLKGLAANLNSQGVPSYLELSRRGGRPSLFTPPTPVKGHRRI